MYIFYGKLNWSYYVKAEPLVLLFPGDLGYYDPVCAYWQWTVNGNGNKKVNNWQETFITSITKEHDGSLRLGFDFDNIYLYTVTVAEDANTVKLTMRDKDGMISEPQILRQSFWGPEKIPSCSVYVGKFEDRYYAHNEMLTVVVPKDFDSGSHVCAYFQWTKDAHGVKSSINHIVTRFRTVYDMSDGGAAFEFVSEDSYYVWDGSVNKDRTSLTLKMHKAKDYPSDGGSGPFNLSRVGWSAHTNRKALIVRYGVGTDGGIFAVRDLLTKTLGWSPNCVEMLYYNVEPKLKPAMCHDGQKAPTVSRFKEKFSDLIHDANGGNVRFLYVDAHGSPQSSSSGSGEKDKLDEGWKLAHGEDGLQSEILYDNWLADTITEHLPSEVNLTILTSSCLGGGMLDTHRGTRGVLLAGVHESQFNVKIADLEGQDPWTYAVVKIINENYKTRNRAMPTYTQLYKEAKQLIVSQMSAKKIRSKQYLGPSPDERNPLPYRDDNGIFSSHQDPQLVFLETYLNADTERFLYPISGWKPKTATTRPEPTKRYPEDEL